MDGSRFCGITQDRITFLPFVPHKKITLNPWHGKDNFLVIFASCCGQYVVISSVPTIIGIIKFPAPSIRIPPGERPQPPSPRQVVPLSAGLRLGESGIHPTNRGPK